MINSIFNIDGLNRPSDNLSEDSESDSDTSSEAASFASGEDDSIDLLNMAELSPAYTENAYAIFVTDVVRSYAMQGRLDDALSFGRNELSRSHHLRPDIESALESTLLETQILEFEIKAQPDFVDLTPAQVDSLRQQNADLRYDEPAFKHPSGALFVQFDDAKAQPDPETLRPEPIFSMPAPHIQAPHVQGPMFNSGVHF